MIRGLFESKPGSRLATGSSSRRRPSPTSCSTTVATKVLVMLPTRYSAVGRSGVPVASSPTPAEWLRAAWWASLTRTMMPGTPVATTSLSAASSSVLVASMRGFAGGAAALAGVALSTTLDRTDAATASVDAVRRRWWCNLPLVIRAEATQVASGYGIHEISRGGGRDSGSGGGTMKDLGQVRTWGGRAAGKGRLRMSPKAASDRRREADQLLAGG